jgi:hypothetical protein
MFELGLELLLGVSPWSRLAYTGQANIFVSTVFMLIHIP